jgi:hypothetical protein
MHPKEWRYLKNHSSSFYNEEGEVKHLGPYLCFGNFDDPYFWTNKFIEIVVVLVEIRKIFSQKCCLWMTQGKCIFIEFSILPVKVISGEMTRLLE